MSLLMCVESQNKALKLVWSVKCASDGFPEKQSVPLFQSRSVFSLKRFSMPDMILF